MKKILVLLLIITVFTGCKCKKEAVQNDKELTMKISNECPENAVCTQEIFKDSALKVEIDGANKPYYTVVKQSGTTVYKYEMAENQDQQYVDGGYREEIIFELPSNFKNGTITDNTITNTKALFGVFCYCKGKAGYYPIEEGSITKTDESITIEIPSIVEGQKVFSYTFKLKG